MTSHDGMFDAIVIGSGAGGAPVAETMSRCGKRVLVIEKGSLHDRLGPAHASAYVSTTRSSEGLNIMRACMGGGTTIISAASSVRCLQREFEEHGIDLEQALEETERDLGIQEVPDNFLGSRSRRLMDAARHIGLDIAPMPKCIDFACCDQCGTCMAGCDHGCKWTSLDNIRNAEASGAVVWYGTEALRIAEGDGENGVVYRKTDGTEDIVWAPVVVVAAGGLETPVILQRSGIEAGTHLSVDMLSHFYGFVPGEAFEPELPMPLLIDRSDEGYIIAPNINGSAVKSYIARSGRDDLSVDNVIGLMIKIADTGEGRVYEDGTVSKRVTEAEEAIFEQARHTARSLLEAAGAEPDTFFESPINGAHPLGTAAIGEVVDSFLETRIEGLYVCDASVLPRAPGLPPIVTIVALGKWLGKALCESP
jgi:choline dehydrogenase-like flavoprotein